MGRTFSHARTRHTRTVTSTNHRPDRPFGAGALFFPNYRVQPTVDIVNNIRPLSKIRDTSLDAQFTQQLIQKIDDQAKIIQSNAAFICTSNSGSGRSSGGPQLDRHGDVIGVSSGGYYDAPSNSRPKLWTLTHPNNELSCQITLPENAAEREGSKNFNIAASFSHPIAQTMINRLDLNHAIPNLRNILYQANITCGNPGCFVHIDDLTNKFWDVFREQKLLIESVMYANIDANGIILSITQPSHVLAVVQQRGFLDLRREPPAMSPYRGTRRSLVLIEGVITECIAALARQVAMDPQVNCMGFKLTWN
eukprot:TRINITY_DN7022_c0_g1_i4.p1 TRINITY_DN7022_c0_g1~~TRINITY_DN7022_c0_g1_i4.p1  ORF type:complete len:308 (-),score=54.37 TRINITY_DN7022_c0_g1_i4:520-1443(-)